MCMRINWRPSSFCPVIFSALLSVVVPTFVIAGDYQVLGGDSCQLRNPKTKNAASLRQIDGTLQNDSDTLSATISCGIPTVQYDASRYDVAGALNVYFLNSHPSEEQRFNCEFNKGLFGSLVKKNRTSGGIDILPGKTGSLKFDHGVLKIIKDFSTNDIAPPLIMICDLPPQSSILSIEIVDSCMGDQLADC